MMSRPRFMTPASAVLFMSVFLCAGCNFSAAPQGTSAPAVSQKDPACPSVPGKLPNLELKNIPADALPYLTKYSLPNADSDAFCRYLERIQHDHEVKIEEGLLEFESSALLQEFFKRKRV